MSIFLQSLRAKGLWASDFAPWGTCEPSRLDSSAEGWLAEAGGSTAPSKQLRRGTGAGGHTVFWIQILWSFCQTGVYKAKPSREFSYFLAYSPSVHLNRNQLFAFSLRQHVAEENLASGLAIIKNKNILLCGENSTTGNKRTEIICIRDPEMDFGSVSTPSPAPLAFILKFPAASIICLVVSFFCSRETERTSSFPWEAGTTRVLRHWSTPAAW